jgi:heptose I phosphotransferase
MRWRRNTMHMPDELRRAFADTDAHNDLFEHVMALRGQEFRNVPGRRTLRFELLGRSYFAKLHSGVGWGEIFKSLMTLKLPIIGARTEWLAIRRLDQIGIATTPAVAYGRKGWSPAALRSFVITKDLGDIVSLETYCQDWRTQPPAPRLKLRILQAVAELARKLHDNGMNHRDFYTCHLCLDNARLASDEIYLYLVDLHRVGIRQKIRPAARMKDVAALYFSAMDLGLSRRDYLRFMRDYSGDLRKALTQDKRFWLRVEARARRLYHKFHGRWPSALFDARD